MYNIKIHKYGRSLFINVEVNKPKWLVAILFPFYWRFLPWQDTPKLPEPSPKGFDNSGHGGPKC